MHLPADTDAASVATVLRRDGCVAVDDVAPLQLRQRFQAEMAEHLAATATGPDEFSGLNTRRTGALIARSPTAREPVMHPLALGTTSTLLGTKKSAFQFASEQAKLRSLDEPRHRLDARTRDDECILGLRGRDRVVVRRIGILGLVPSATQAIYRLEAGHARELSVHRFAASMHAPATGAR